VSDLLPIKHREKIFHFTTHIKPWNIEIEIDSKAYSHIMYGMPQDVLAYLNYAKNVPLFYEKHKNDFYIRNNNQKA
jgi:hypothetical protein